MHAIERRLQQAEALWRQADERIAAGDGAAAYALCTQAHDLIMDCPRLHERAHRALRRVSARHGHRGEICIDTLLLWLAPLRVFEAIAWAQRSSVAFDSLCRRDAAVH